MAGFSCLGIPVSQSSFFSSPCCSCISCSWGSGQRIQGWGMEAPSSLLGRLQPALLAERFPGEARWWWLHSSVSGLGTVELYTETGLQWQSFMYVLPWLRKKWTPSGFYPGWWFFRTYRWFLSSCLWLFSWAVVSDSLGSHEWHARFLCPSLSPRVCSSSCRLGIILAHLLGA